MPRPGLYPVPPQACSILSATWATFLAAANFTCHIQCRYCARGRASRSLWIDQSQLLVASYIAKRHTTMKKHADVGMRVADYPTIQDYVGDAHAYVRMLLHGGVALGDVDQ